MTETLRTADELIALMPDNSVGAITEERLRSFVASIMPSSQAVEVTVTSVDAPDTARVKTHYPCDGVADDVQINAAIQKVASSFGKGTVRLIGTLFNTNADIIGATGVNLVSHGFTCIITPNGNVVQCINYDGCESFRLEDFAINANALVSNEQAINWVDCSDAWATRVKVYNSTAFGMFMHVRPNNKSKELHLTDCKFQGRATNDVIGGGCQDSDPDTEISDIWIKGCTVETDIALGGTYEQALAMTKVKNLHVEGNTFRGSVGTSDEQFPSNELWFKDNKIERAVGSSNNAALSITAVSGATSPHTDIFIVDNKLTNSAIQLSGISGQKLEGFEIRGNQIRTTNIQNGIHLLYCSGGLVAGGRIQDVTAGVYLENCDTVTVNDVKVKTGLYGIRDVTGVASITGHGNMFSGISTAYIVGGSGWFNNYPAQTIRTFEHGDTGASLTIDPANGINQHFRLTATPVTVTFNSELVPGVGPYTFVFESDGTAGRTLVLPTNFKKSGGVFTKTSAANSKDTLSAVYDVADGVWVEIGRAMDVKN